jgi:hypothetical protein
MANFRSKPTEPLSIAPHLKRVMCEDLLERRDKKPYRQVNAYRQSAYNKKPRSLLRYRLVLRSKQGEITHEIVLKESGTTASLFQHLPNGAAQDSTANLFLKGFICFYEKNFPYILHTIYYLSIGYSTYFCGKVPLFFYSWTMPEF